MFAQAGDNGSLSRRFALGLRFPGLRACNVDVIHKLWRALPQRVPSCGQALAYVILLRSPYPWHCKFAP